MKSRGWCKGIARRTREVTLHATGTWGHPFPEVYMSIRDMVSGERFDLDMTPDEAEELVCRIEFALDALRRNGER